MWLFPYHCSGWRMEKGQGFCCCLQNDCTPVNALSLPYRESLAPWLPKVSFLSPSCGTHSCSRRAPRKACSCCAAQGHRQEQSHPLWGADRPVTVAGTRGQKPFVPKASYQHPNLPGCSWFFILTQNIIPASGMLFHVPWAVPGGAGSASPSPHPTSSGAGQRPRKAPRKKSPELKAEPEAPSPKVSSFVAVSVCPAAPALFMVMIPHGVSHLGNLQL